MLSYLIYAWSYILTAVLSVGLGLFILLKNNKKKINQVWFLVSSSTALWSLGLWIAIKAPNQVIALFGQRLLYIGTILIPIFFFYFCSTFLRKNKRNKIFIYTGEGFAVFFILSLFTKYFISGVQPRTAWGYWPVTTGVLYWPFLIYFAFYVIYSLALLKMRARIRHGRSKKQTQFIFYASLIGFLGGSTNFFLDFFSIPPIGNFFVALYVVLIAYAITKYHLFSIKMISTEILLATMMILLFVLPFIMPTITLKVLTSVTFLLFCIFSYYLVKVNYREEKRRKEAERFSQAKTEFLAIASHQLRTPLTAVRGYISMMRHGVYGKLPSGLHEPLREVYQSTLRLVKLTNRLLNASRIETGRLNMNLQNISLEKLITSILQEFAPQAEEKHLYLKFQKPKEPLPLIQADPEKIRQVLINLLDNSLKYTQKGGVTINLHPIDKEAVEVKIKDTGVGMTKKELRKVFKSFSRGQAGKKFHASGAGLGLYIAKKFVQLHQGKIWATSSGPGKGSIMWVDLPLKLDSVRLKKDLKSFSESKGEKLSW